MIPNFSKRVNQESRPLSRLGREKRDCTRVEVSLPATIWTSQDSTQGHVTNISLSGAFIILRKLPNLDQDLQLAIDMPNYSCAVFATTEIVRLEILHID